VASLSPIEFDQAVKEAILFRDFGKVIHYEKFGTDGEEIGPDPRALPAAPLSFLGASRSFRSASPFSMSGGSMAPFDDGISF
jgi:hypothetical protein